MDSIKFAERHMGLTPTSHKMDLARVLAKRCSNDLDTERASAEALSVHDIMVLEAIANGHYRSTLTSVDEFYAYACLLLIYSSKRMSNLQTFDFSQLCKLMQGERTTPWSDKSGKSAVESKVFWIKDDEFFFKPWIHLGAHLGPQDQRDFIVPKPSKDYTTWLNRPATIGECSKWLVRLFIGAGYSEEEAWKKRKVHALRKTLIQMSASDGNHDSTTRRLAGWSSIQTVQSYTVKCDQVLQTKKQIIAKRKIQGGAKSNRTGTVRQGSQGAAQAEIENLSAGNNEILDLVRIPSQPPPKPKKRSKACISMQNKILNQDLEEIAEEAVNGCFTHTALPSPLFEQSTVPSFNAK